MMDFNKSRNFDGIQEMAQSVRHSKKVTKLEPINHDFNFKSDILTSKFNKIGNKSPIVNNKATSQSFGNNMIIGKPETYSRPLTQLKMNAQVSTEGSPTAEKRIPINLAFLQQNND